MSLRRFKSGISTLVVGLAGAAAVGFCLTVSHWQLETAWRAHVERIDADMQVKGERIGYRLQAIAENLRSIAFTPGVRRIVSASQMLNPFDDENISQIVAKLSSRFSGVQVYVTPQSFDPKRLDPDTGLLQAPAICFECTRFNSKSAQSQLGNSFPVYSMTMSQRQIVSEHTDWLKSKFKEKQSLEGLEVPFISSGRVSIKAASGSNKKAEKSQTHIVFSVPYYNQAGEFGGIVSAAIPTGSFNKIVPYGPYAIQSPGGEYRSNALVRANARDDWKPSFLDANANETTFGSQYDIAASDPRGHWTLHARNGAVSFYESQEFRLIKQYAIWAIAVSVLLTGLGMAWVFASYRKAKQLKHNATHDALTGLPNRVLLQNLMQLCVLDIARKKSTAMVLYLDLDRFKLVNDTLGHHVGDLVLKEASKTIVASIRTNDVLARMGGDEFVVLMRDCKEPAEAMTVAGRIIENISKPMHIDGHVINIGTSIGISILRGDSQSPDEVIRCADLALFRAKTEERGSYRFYEPDMDAERLQRRQMEMDLRFAVNHNELVLHYQPIINAATGNISSCEALVRWQHPQRGLIAPFEFIPLAEELGLINKIGEWVLNQACLDATQMPDDIQVAVNVSALQIKNPSFPLHVLTALNTSGLSPHRLELELTESIMASGDPVVLTAAKQLRDIGVHIALDDFGVGFSSFSCLKDFEFDRIKIDKSFLQNIERNKEAAIFHAIARMGAELGVSTTAEGVETEAQLDTVMAQGCTDAQGYYFSKPKPINEVSDYMRIHKSRSGKIKGKTA